MVGIVSVGVCIGGLFISRAADPYGRKIGIMSACGVYIVGVLIQITASHAWYQVFIGRLIGGIGIGASAVMASMFQSETAPQEIRVMLVSSFQLFITLGILIDYFVCYETNDRKDTGAYRIPMGLCFAWALILMIGMISMPETPDTL